MRNLLFCIVLLLPVIVEGQIKLSLGESKDSIEIPRMFVNGVMHPATKGHALYSWKNKSFEAHIVKLDQYFFVYYSDMITHYSYKINNFNITSCEIYAEGVNEIGRLSIKDECGVLFRFSTNGKTIQMSDYYRSYSDVIFKENINQYFAHRYFKIQ